MLALEKLLCWVPGYKDKALKAQMPVRGVGSYPQNLCVPLGRDRENSKEEAFDPAWGGERQGKCHQGEELGSPAGEEWRHRGLEGTEARKSLACSRNC